MHGAWCHEHADGFKRAAGNGCSDVLDGVDDVGHVLNLFFAQAGFVGACGVCGVGDDEVGLDAHGFEEFKCSHAIDEASGATDADDDALCLGGAHGVYLYSGLG